MRFRFTPEQQAFRQEVLDSASGLTEPLMNGGPCSASTSGANYWVTNNEIRDNPRNAW